VWAGVLAGQRPVSTSPDEGRGLRQLHPALFAPAFATLPLSQRPSNLQRFAWVTACAGMTVWGRNVATPRGIPRGSSGGRASGSAPLGAGNAVE